jgi:hypothetical protein
MTATVATLLEEDQARWGQEVLEEITFATAAGLILKWISWTAGLMTAANPSTKAKLAELDEALYGAKKTARLASTLPEKLERPRSACTLEADQVS